MDLIRGLVTRSQSGFYAVQTDQGELQARLRGRLKKGRQATDVVALGDWVQVSPPQEDQPAMIEAVEPRRRALVRQSPRPSGPYEQVIVANLDQVFFVFAVADPEPRYRMLDRFLIIAEQQRIPARIVANKTDLVGEREAKQQFGHYEKLGYPVIYTSVVKGTGVRTLHKALQGKVSVLAGPSGVGKSSLLNALEPDLGLRVGAVSEATGKGSHTTVVRSMFPLEVGGYVADTPGLKALALWDIEPEELDGYFPEIAPLVTECRFRNCTHTQEPGCAVREAVEQGTVHPERYDSYLRLRSDLEQGIDAR